MSRPATWKTTLLLTLAVGCSRHASAPVAADAGPADRCGPALDHVFGVMTSDKGVGFAERMMVNAIASQAAGACRKGGLSEAQAACLLAVKTPEDIQALPDCPALKAHPIEWMSLGPSDLGGAPR
jgi:hypothetical protein